MLLSRGPPCSLADTNLRGLSSHLISGPERLLRTMIEFMVLLQLESMLMPMAYIPTKGQKDAYLPDGHL